METTPDSELLTKDGREILAEKHPRARFIIRLMDSPVPSRMRTERDLDGFLDAFEAGSLPKPEWTHAAHLAVATCYLLSYSDEETLNELRKRIRFLNDCHETLNSPNSGYHETLTRFWLLVLRRFLNTLPQETSRVSAVEQTIVAFVECKKLYESYYSFDVVKSQAARESWIPPDKYSTDPLPTGRRGQAVL